MTSKGPIGTINTKSSKVSIVGAGFSGLILGYFLKKEGFEVAIYEKTTRTGGLIQTLKTTWGPVETAANTLYPNDDVWDLLKEINLNHQPARTKLKKKLIRTNKVLSFPFTIIESLQLFFGLFRKVPTTVDLSVKDFLIDWMGEKIVDEVVTTMLTGIYGTGAHELHFNSLYPDFQGKRYWDFVFYLINRRREQSSRYPEYKPISFSGGMETLIKKLEEKLKDCIHFGEIPHLENETNIIYCTNAIDASSLTEKKHPILASHLKTIPYTAIRTTTIFVDKEIPQLQNSFGVLASRQSFIETLGILNNSAIFSKRARENTFSYTFIQNLKDNYLELIAKDFLSLSKIQLEQTIKHHQTTVWPMAFPCYNKQREIEIQKIRNYLSNKNGIVLFGNYTGGISLREMISGARRFAMTQKESKK